VSQAVTATHTALVARAFQALSVTVQFHQAAYVTVTHSLADTHIFATVNTTCVLSIQGATFVTVYAVQGVQVSATTNHQSLALVIVEVAAISDNTTSTVVLFVLVAESIVGTTITQVALVAKAFQAKSVTVPFQVAEYVTVIQSFQDAQKSATVNNT
jgi:predicted SpoU family rRNA methylase